VSTEQGVSVFAVEKYVTQIRYVPAATVPPTVEVDAAVAVEVEEFAPTTTAGGAATTDTVKLCCAVFCASRGKIQRVKNKKLTSILFTFQNLLQLRKLILG
jgi:hypothetical protein